MNSDCRSREKFFFIGFCRCLLLQNRSKCRKTNDLFLIFLFFGLKCSKLLAKILSISIKKPKISISIFSISFFFFSISFFFHRSSKRSQFKRYWLTKNTHLSGGLIYTALKFIFKNTNFNRFEKMQVSSCSPETVFFNREIFKQTEEF